MLWCLLLVYSTLDWLELVWFPRSWILVFSSIIPLSSWLMLLAHYLSWAVPVTAVSMCAVLCQRFSCSPSSAYVGLPGLKVLVYFFINQELVRCWAVAHVPERGISLKRHVIGWWFDGMVPLWVTLMIRIVLPCVSQSGWVPAVSSLLICGSRHP